MVTVRCIAARVSGARATLPRLLAFFALQPELALVGIIERAKTGGPCTAEPGGARGPAASPPLERS